MLLAWIGGVVWIVLGFCWIVLVVLVLVGGVVWIVVWIVVESPSQQEGGVWVGFGVWRFCVVWVGFRVWRFWQEGVVWVGFWVWV